ncbi:MAG TPA: hypothetical protein DET40_21590 [Lentisphaeria bacterium]|nr:MAG: hypothetical protein A2X45_03500 [Lentisphaerae bacterium GWF2_50_93]HCE46146.1 hypothetical protein [Lentisphaeria bacterium]
MKNKKPTPKNLTIRNGTYYLIHMVNGKRTSLSLETKSESVAKTKRNEILDSALTAKSIEKVNLNIAEARQLITDAKFSIKLIWSKYLEKSDRPQSGKGSLENYERYLKAFIKWIGDKHPQIERVNQITEKEAKEYLDSFWADNNISHTTWNHHLQGLKLIFKHITSRKETPFSKFKKMKGTQINRLDFTPVHLEAIFKTLDDPKFQVADKAEFKVMCYFGAYTGARLGDVIYMKWGNVDFAKRRLTYVPSKTKGVKADDPITVSIKLHSELKAQLDLLHTDDKDRNDYILPTIAGRYSNKHTHYSVVMDFIRLLDHVGLKARAEAGRGMKRRLYGFHSFRHGFASQAVDAGIPISVLSKILGDNIGTLQKYYVKVTDRAMDEAVESISVAEEGKKMLPEANEPSKLDAHIKKALSIISKADETDISEKFKARLLKVLQA